VREFAGLAMSSENDLRAKAQDLLRQAKAAEGRSESLVYLMCAMEYDQEADLLEHLDAPAIAAQGDGTDSENA
jgi:hypothetical protein